MKKQNFSHFIGIDISKLTFDVAIMGPSGKTTSFVFDNTKKGISAFFRMLRNQKVHLDDTLICAEPTGVYGKLIISRLVEKECHLCVEMSLKIMRSSGLRRGKSDRLDAITIANYAVKNHRQMEQYESVPEVLERIRTLATIRDRLVRNRADMMKYPKELEHFDPKLAILAKRNIKNSIKSFDKEIKRIEVEIMELVLSDNRLNRTIALATSVTGIGWVTALQLTIHTNLFTRYKDPKQLACYCGVVPFEHSSGTSIHKRPRVSHMANKPLKRLLHLGALSAMAHNPEIRAYYERKVAEGKSKMLVINNIRNKLIQRVCAVIKRQRPYNKDHCLKFIDYYLFLPWKSGETLPYPLL